MENASFARHGGRLHEAMRRWPDAPRPWLDLSTGINPRPYPTRHVGPALRARLPDPLQVTELESRAAAAFGVEAARVCAVAGAETAIRWLPVLLAAPEVTLASPIYGGHAEAWTAARADVLQAPRAILLDGAPPGRGPCVLVNPNNPDGVATPAAEMVDLAERLARAGRWLIVDESFVEPTPGLSVAAQAGERLVVLRSFGKFYGLAGVRLGFLVAAPELIARLRERLGDWPVSADALAAGLAAYADEGWAERTRRRLAPDAARLDGLLRQAGFEEITGTALFRYARAADAARRFERLAGRGVLARPIDHSPDRLRFGLPPATAWRRLETALLETAR